MSELAYLVIREGSKWSDVFRLVPGQSVTVGRAPTSQIVLKDERCSRSHLEIFSSGDDWVLRDLDSRNGTLVGTTLVRGDWVLHVGDIIRVGHSQLVFVHRLAEAFTDASAILRRENKASGAVVPAHAEVGADVLDDDLPTITHRRGQTRFLEPDQESEGHGLSESGLAATRLCRLAFEMAGAPDTATIADLALNGLLDNTQTDAAAIYLLPSQYRDEPQADKLELVASQSRTDKRCHRVSNGLAGTVMREGEAVLARNVMGDSTLGSRDSKGEIHTTGVICAPLRRGRKVFGLVHLYSTSIDRGPDPDDLEFTLAVADTVSVAMENLFRRQDLARNLTQVRTENVQLRQRLEAQSEIVGNSKAIRAVTDEITRAAAVHATVLIRGESGVGKELVARAIHYGSPRRDNVFVCLNCAALAESLLASELFGHERGAFTGATERKIGKFEAAHRGTLMLDEIGEMSPSIQAKFLRVLEGHPFERVGGSKPVTADVRVIAATNRDLEKAVAAGEFRRDLFFRLHVIEITVPPLRKRPEDIAVLSEYFLHKYNAETGRKIRGFSPEAIRMLGEYRWPGNIRELKNVIERAVVLCRRDEIGQEDLLLTKIATAGDTEVEATAGEDEFLPASLVDIERKYILATLEHTGWNKSRTAQILGIERSTLDRKIRRYSLDEETPRR